MKFYYQNIKDASLTYSGTEDTGFPVSNLNNPDKNTMFKDTSFTGTTSLKIDLGAARTCNSIVFGNCTINAVTVALAYSVDDVSYSYVQFGMTPDGDEAFEFELTTARYWSVIFFNMPGTNSIELGNIYLSEYFQTVSNEEFLSTNEAEGYGNVSNQTDGGYVFTHETQSEERRNVSYLMGFIDSTEYDKYTTLKEAIKPSDGYSLYPFYYVDSGGDVHFARHYGKFVYTRKAFDIREMTLNLIDEL